MKTSAECRNAIYLWLKKEEFELKPERHKELKKLLLDLMESVTLAKEVQKLPSAQIAKKPDQIRVKDNPLRFRNPDFLKNAKYKTPEVRVWRADEKK